MHDAALILQALNHGARTVDVSVDPVKAAIELVWAQEGDDAATSIMRAMGRIVTAFQRAELELPLTVASIECEAIPGPVEPDPYVATLE